jgi:hypothetical protein
MSTSASGPIANWTPLAAARGCSPSPQQSMYFGYIGMKSENKKRGMIPTSRNQDVFLAKICSHKTIPHLIFFRQRLYLRLAGLLSPR